MLNSPAEDAVRSPIAASVATLLAVTGAAIALVLAVEVAVPLSRGDGPVWLVVTGPTSAAILALIGGVATWLRPSNRSGAIMIAGALLAVIAAARALDITALTVPAIVLQTVALAVLVHLLLAFPSGRLVGRAARITVIAGYGVCLALQIPLYLFDPAASPSGLLAVADVPTAAAVGQSAQSTLGLAVMVSTAVILAARFRRAGPRERRVIGPLYLYGVAAVIAVPLTRTVLEPLTGISADVGGLIQVAIVTAVPATVAWAMLHGGFGRTGSVAELAARLSAADDSPGTLTAALARSLGDPSVRLVFHGDDPATLFDEEGRAVASPTGHGGQPAGAVQVTIAGRPVAALHYDPTLNADRSLVAAAGRTVAMALDRARLAAQLRAQHRELEDSRARLVRAGDAERRRLAQDLHDGLQAELVLLGLQAQELAARLGTGPDRAGADAAVALRRRIDGAAQDLREFVHGFMPPALVSLGLGAAVEDLLDRIPIATRLDAPESEALGTIASHTQSTAYFVIAESLTNAMKHARAALIEVSLRVREGRLYLDVTDDGVGVAAGGGAGRGDRGRGHGLDGLRDRVAAVGGRLVIDTPTNGGTRVSAELPCGS